MLTPARWPDARFSDRTLFDGKYWAHMAKDSEHGCQKVRGKMSAPCSAKERKGRIRDDALKTATTGHGAPLNATGAIATMNIGSWMTYQVRVNRHVPRSREFSYTADFRLI